MQRPHIQEAVAAAAPGGERTGASATFAELLKRVKAEGLLDLDPRYYVGKLALNTALLAVGFVAFFELGNTWWQLLTAVWMGLCGGQSAFMWHDAGHKAMFRSKKAASAVGYVHANLVNGVSYGWWVNHHNRHHSNPNHLDMDPDIGRRTAIFDIKQYPTRKGTQKLVVRYQSVMFFVLLVLEGFKMLKTAVVSITGGKTKRPLLETSLILLRAAVYLTCVFTFLSPGLAVAFIVVQHAALGVYFGMIFAPNHKGMQVRDGEEETLDWLQRQVLTSRNIRPSLFIDFLYGGLNYQVEHHLFPAMPQKSLPRARELTMEYCAERGVPYHEVGFWRSYREVASFLHKVSAPVRRGDVDEQIRRRAMEAA
ncbi:acyl-CoA desaturase [Streptomyces sp. TR1341]|uniref:Fatty acid desaturase n=1 Tax=Streptomyces murinus TaxID=33900 RepID=A0A7W3NTX7_STRMR|nr:MULTISPECIES: acyl-CoA desaturase [Streptomyces]NDK24158.1 acyl-CoA desaturase [Streptomyces sp. TR1341]MBA9056628.1 fatty acid desaturase [Streptomyces murinus]UWW91062.1 acyl-CoA desaturase [Streptomyces murinus]WSI88312.1 acyl-CoA desaturase [Streptomyces murinus]WUD09942.1 acyl-CoA desaturase [Streptomyces murinus]